MENPDALKHETVLDTGAEQLGKTYAQALLAASQKQGKTDLIVQQLSELVDDYLANNPKLAAAFASPRIDVEEKNRVIDRLFGETFDPMLVTFLKVMASRDRLGQLAAVRQGLVEKYDEMSGRVLAKVRTAVPLDDNLRSQITERLGGVLNKEVRLQEVVDADLIGGMVIRIGDTVFDSSVATRLEGIAKRAREGFSSRLMENFDQLTQ
ncbi:ATP synthase F1 subunit delta [Roseiconus nitratireducens]|uniref:ATP synthase subunit delta n=1 Tax=Roseiconus nitratireducens TaxID=2605748 RepID=A0A5M6DG69_9BACT|nr:ATP synthase F1 subunit delta [Roseiconus nitratireducens]KAA5545199.1 ATP synthase F1 subunit delta [Roseiconus nitratireducens]